MISWKVTVNKALAISVGAVLAMSVTIPVNNVSAVESTSLKRLGGANRYETSAKISQEIDALGVHSDTVLITRGDLYPDALSGGSLAARNNAPILLTATDSLQPETQAEIQRRKPTRAIILGGTGAVSESVASRLKSLGVSQVDRIGGADRYAVSAGTAEQTVAGGTADTAIVASGQNFPDALSASSIAAEKGWPILLVTTDSIPTPIQAFLSAHTEIKNLFIVGGAGVVSDQVKSELAKYGTVYRIGGANRFETSVNIARYFNTSPQSLVFTTGLDFPDALSGGPLAGLTKSPIILTCPDSIPPEVSAYLTGQQGKFAKGYILGGTGAVSADLEQKFNSYLKLSNAVPAILYHTAYNALGDPEEGLYIINADGSNKRQLFSGGVRSSEISPDGTKVVFCAAGKFSSDIYTINVDGSNLTQLTNNMYVQDYDPTWSSDGSQIAFIRDYIHFYTMNADGTNEKPIYDEITGHACGLHWSPIDNRILFSSDSAGMDNDVFMIRSDGTGLVDLTKTDKTDYRQREFDEGGATWSSDGQKIIFQDYNATIYTMNPDGSNRTVIKESAGTAPHFSPDGSKIAINVGVPTGQLIQLINADGSNPQFITQSGYVYVDDYALVIP